MVKLPFVTSRIRVMTRELKRDPDSGFLWGKFFTSKKPFTTLFLTYWTSSEHIHRFVSDPKYSHIRSSLDYYKTFRNDPHIGVWHETYEVLPGHAETMYYGMDPFGASAFLPTEEIQRHRQQYMTRLRSA
jgi:hypothetical protein